MAMQLQLDGKVLGSIDENGKLHDAEGTPIISPKTKEARPQIQVPLPPNPKAIPSDEGADDDDEPATREPATDDDEALDLDPKNPKDAEIIALKSQLDIFQRVINQLQAAPQTQRTQNLIQATKEAIQDHIPDNLDKEKDPFGLAATMKGMVKVLNNLNSRVERLDQHTGYEAGVKLLEAEKSRHDVFKDKKLAPLADKVLQAELATSADPLPLIVQRVAEQFKGLATDGGKKYLKEKVDQLSKVPHTLRKKDGASPAITINKPRNVAEARESYQAWREARNKATQR